MDSDIIKRRQRELSKQQAIYVAKRETGASREASAIFAGYPANQKAGEQVEESPVVQAELEKARAALVKATGLTRESIAQMMMDAVEMARVMADPQAMIRGAAELAKLLGLNAPEVKKHLHSLDKDSREAIRGMTDEELHRLKNGRLIEGEATRVDDTQAD